jgi:hypothetical protein
MARTLLTATLLTPDSAAANLTAIAAAGTAPSASGAGNGVTLPNYPGQSFLLVSVGTTATTATVQIGTTEFGQGATGFSVALTVSALNLLGPFHTAMDQVGGILVAVDFNNTTAVLCAALQALGVY